MLDVRKKSVLCNDGISTFRGDAFSHAYICQRQFTKNVLTIQSKNELYESDLANPL